MFLNEPGLGVTGIDPSMALTPFPCSIWKRQDSNPRPYDCEFSLLSTTRSSQSKTSLTSKHDKNQVMKNDGSSNFLITVKLLTISVSKPLGNLYLYFLRYKNNDKQSIQRWSKI